MGFERFPVDNTNILLHLYNESMYPLDKAAVRRILFHSYTIVENIIDVAGDGAIPQSAKPFQEITAEAYVEVDIDNEIYSRMKWSELKDTLWGLREYTVVQGHWFPLRFIILRTGVNGGHLGEGVLHTASL